jgi:DNA-binding winged helix-turn-helix (wHTH) protein
MHRGPVFLFGQFQLDTGSRRLTRGAEQLVLSDRQYDVLLVLVSRPGEVVSKDALIAAAWKDIAVTDNSLEQAISGLRRLLGPSHDGSTYIETLARRGYRFSSGVTQAAARESDAALEAILAPYRVFLEGRAAMETLELDAVGRAADAFRRVLASAPDYGPGHVGLANALALSFDATRADAMPDVASLGSAVQHAREACRLDAESGESWATLAFVLSRMGAVTEAVASARRAIAIEPHNWRHYMRLAYASWGEERLRAAQHALRLLPGLALGHWLAATVHVARQALTEAARELAPGASAQDRQHEGGRFRGVGLHLLTGLVALARGDVRSAEDEFARELEFGRSGHVYARQASANTWCAIGAIRLRASRTDEAIEAFRRALEHVPGHLQTLAAMTVVADPGTRSALRAQLDSRLAMLSAVGAVVEAAMGRAIACVLADRPDEAAALVDAALQAAPAGTSSGWTLPVEPLLNVTARPDVWSGALATLRVRAA